MKVVNTSCRPHWPSGLKGRSAVVRLLVLRIRIPPGHGYLSVVNVVCCTGKDFCEGPIFPTEESYRLWCVCGIWCDQIKK
jgi:hypothetical protein